MFTRRKSALVCAALACAVLLSAPVRGVEEGQQVTMLKRIFRCPQADWPGLLRENVGLLDPSFFQRVEARIRCSMDNNQIDDAIRFALVGDLACQAVGRVGNYRRALAVGFHNLGNDEQTLVYNMLQTEPNAAEALFLRAAYRRTGGDLAGARDDYERLVQLKFRPQDCAYYLSSIYQELGQPKIAQSWFLRSNRGSPALDPPNHYLDNPYQLGDHYSFSNEIPLTHTIDPARHDDYFCQGEEAFRAGQMVEAESFYRDAIVANPQPARYWMALGALHYRIGRPEQGIEEIRRGLSLDPASLQCWRFLGCCYERQFDRNRSAADLEKARAAFGKVLRLKPADPLASPGWKCLSKVCSIFGHFSTASNVPRVSTTRLSGMVCPDTYPAACSPGQALGSAGWGLVAIGVAGALASEWKAADHHVAAEDSTTQKDLLSLKRFHLQDNLEFLSEWECQRRHSEWHDVNGYP